jgi:hypothetical protein
MLEHTKQDQQLDYPMTTCTFCERRIVFVDGVWVDPAATGDDSIWREVCDSHDTFTAEHEPQGDVRS